MWRDFMPSFYANAEIHLDIAASSQQNMFTLADFQKFAGFEAGGRDTGKNPVLKSSSEEKSVSWLDDVRLRC
jgi:hypothetical protein